MYAYSGNQYGLLSILSSVSWLCRLKNKKKWNITELCKLLHKMGSLLAGQDPPTTEVAAAKV